MYEHCIAILEKAKSNKKITDKGFNNLKDLLEYIIEATELNESLEVFVNSTVYELSFEGDIYYVNIESGCDVLSLEGREYNSGDTVELIDMARDFLNGILDKTDSEDKDFTKVFAME